MPENKEPGCLSLLADIAVWLVAVLWPFIALFFAVKMHAAGEVSVDAVWITLVVVFSYQLLHVKAGQIND